MFSKILHEHNTKNGQMSHFDNEAHTKRYVEQICFKRLLE